MLKLIYLTGQIESPFLLNEIQAFCDEFEEVLVVAYDGNREKCDELSHKYGFRYKFISDIKTVSISELLNWRKKEYVKKELRKISGINARSIKMRVYVYIYGIYALKLKRILSNYIRMEDECYMYSFWLSRPGYGVACARDMLEAKIVRSVSRTHRYDLYEEENSVGYLPFRNFIAEHLDTIYFSSIDTIEYFSNKNYSTIKLPSYKLSYLGTIDHGQKETNTKKNTIVIASCSYIIYRKRLDLIIKFVKHLSNFEKPVKWIHIGDGKDEHDIKELASKELINCEYNFLGRMDDEEIFENYKKYDVDFFINMSDSEGIPVSILEAMSIGIPVIARNVGGISDAVDMNCGVLFDKNKCGDEDLLQMAVLVEDIFTDKTKYKKISCNAYEKWDKYFNADKNASMVAKDIISDGIINKME